MRHLITMTVVVDADAELTEKDILESLADCADHTVPHINNWFRADEKNALCKAMLIVGSMTIQEVLDA